MLQYIHTHIHAHILCTQKLELLCWTYTHTLTLTYTLTHPLLHTNKHLLSHKLSPSQFRTKHIRFVLNYWTIFWFISCVGSLHNRWKAPYCPCGHASAKYPADRSITSYSPLPHSQLYITTQTWCTRIPTPSNTHTRIRKHIWYNVKLIY